MSSSKYITLCFIGNHIKLLNGCLSRVVKARYSYNPGVDSPNEINADVREKSVNKIIVIHGIILQEELYFQLGDVITVCGEVDNDGFFMVRHYLLLHVHTYGKHHAD